MSCSQIGTSMTPIRLVRGASKTLLFTVRVDSVSGEMSASIAGIGQALTSGSPVDLTGAKVWFTIKNRVEDVSALVAKRNTVAGGVDNQILVVVPQVGIAIGQFRVLIDVADTAPLDPSASYWGDAFVQMPGGPPINRQQVMANRQFVVDSTITTVF